MPTILIVDPDLATCERIRRLLGDDTFCIDASDRDAALRVVAESKIDLAIVAATADFDGCSVLTALRAVAQIPAAIVLLDKLTTSRIAVLREHAVDTFLLNGCSDDDLRATIDKNLSAPTAPLETADPVFDLAKVVPVRAMLVGMAADHAETLAGKLRSRGIQAQISTPELRAQVRRDPWHVLIIARLAGLGRAEIAELQQLLYENPSLKLVVIARDADEADVATLRALGLRRVLSEPIGVDAIANAAAAELAQHHFDPQVVDALRVSLVQLLADSPITVKPALVQMRVSSQVLARTTALVEISGSDLVGRITLSGDPTVLAKLAEHWLGEVPRTRDAIWDAAGELANRVAAEIRTHYYQRGLNSIQSPPIVIESADAEIRQASKKPGLVFSSAVEGFDSEVHLEWFISHKSAVEFTQPASSVPTDEIAFF